MNPAGNPRESRLLTEDAVAEQLGCSIALLRKWRYQGGGPAYCRLGRLVRYPASSVQEFVDAKLKRNEEEGYQQNAA